MSRITKSISEQVAESMTKHMLNQIDTLESGITYALRDNALSQVPLSVMAAYASCPEYFKVSSSIRVSHPDLNLTGYWELRAFVSKDKMGYLCIPSAGSIKLNNLSAKDIKSINDLFRKYEQLKKEYKKLKGDLETLIYGLRTYAKVTEKLPEAIPFLPAIKQNEGLSVNISDIRNRLKTA